MAGFNFRTLLSYVTDAPGDYYVAEQQAYPTEYETGLNYGYLNAPITGNDGRDRAGTQDVRLKGVHFNNTNSRRFRVDLPAAGTYLIGMALGDAVASTNLESVIRIYDGSTTLLATILDGTQGGLASGTWYDATGVVRTAAEWVTDNVPLSLTFAESYFELELIPRNPAPSGAEISHLYYEEATPVLALTDVDTDEIVTSDQTGVPVTGIDMGADETERTFDLVQDTVVVPQTETGTGTAIAATLSMAIEKTGTDIRFGAASLRVTRTVDSATASIGITVIPPTGQIYVDLTSVYPLAPNRITAVPDIAIGDQLQARGVGGGAVPSGLSLLADGTASFASGSTPADFDVRVYSDTDKTWGAWATQTAAALAGPTVLFAAFGA